MTDDNASLEPTDLTPTPDRFSEYYGVVLSHQYGGPLRWSHQHSAWLRLRYDGLSWAREPVDGDEVDPEELEAALALAETFPARSHCPRCWRSPTPADHYIVTDITGEPAVWCVQLPSPSVVGSPGGAKKHAGHPLGCIAVEPATVTSAVRGVGDLEVVGGFLYGVPLQADEVMRRTWCSRCAKTVAGLSDDETSDYLQRQHELGARGLIRLIRQQLDLDR